MRREEERGFTGNERGWGCGGETARRNPACLLAKWLIPSAESWCISGIPTLVRFLSTIIFLLIATALANAAPIDSISRVRSLTPEEAAHHLPVTVEATITFYDPTQRDLFIYDGSQGIFALLPNDIGKRPAFGVGSRIRIEGVTQPGGFLPSIDCQRYTILGGGQPPKPVRIEPAELFSPALDCQWVEVPAVITEVESGSWYFTMAATIAGWTIKLQMPFTDGATAQAAGLLQRPVTIRGVVGTVYNSERQLTDRYLFVSSFDQIIPSESDILTSEPQLRAVNELLRSEATTQTRVRVRGTVTQASDNALYIRGTGGGLLIRTASTEGLIPGISVEAEGFASAAPFRPILRATHVTSLGRGEPPTPLPLNLDRKKIADQQAELVFVDADLLGTRTGPGGEVVLQFRSADWVFEAPLPPGAKLPPGIKLNDQIRVTGICELSTSRPLPRTNWVDGFRLHLRDANDLQILHRAPWWTLQRLLWALGIVGFVAFVSTAWVALLRRRVAEQTGIIRSQIEREAVKDERQRIARELHDTIEQELAGLSVQLRNARQRLSESPGKAAAALELASCMLRHCRMEARTSIRDLRSIALEQRGLDGAIEELVAPLAAESGAQFHLQVQGIVRPLPGTTSLHLLRIAHEAVANAARHANPRNIWAGLEYAHDHVSLEIRDDGRGFDPASAAPRGHFGLLGMHERAGKLTAKLGIESRPGHGTTIRITAPIPPATPHPNEKPS